MLGGADTVDGRDGAAKAEGAGASTDSLVRGGGAMGERVRGFDWAATPLGPIAAWPEALRVAVGICLNSRFPMFVWWGPQLIKIYNDGYAPMLGKRHADGALGRPAREVWADIWSVVGPQANAVMTRGEATWNERVLLVMERHGYTEDTWFTWSYSPIPDEQGGVGGLFCACTEETARVRAEADRDRLTAQRQLALDAANMGWWHLDPVTGHVTADERYHAIFGVRAGEPLTYDSTVGRIHPDDQRGVRRAVDRALDPTAAHPFDIEYRVRRPDGTIRWVAAHGRAIFDGEEGTAGRRAVGFAGTVEDVTDAARARDALRT